MGTTRRDRARTTLPVGADSRQGAPPKTVTVDPDLPTDARVR